ncbi:MAG: hypothetical protein HYR75_07920, partial [Gemmatimonadetes bacterium]|nr:hypothetical protein [Gemmatimonadota bacterium]
SLREGVYEYAISVQEGTTVTTFPGGTHQAPWDWDWHGTGLWRTTAVRPGTPLPLFEPAEDVRRLAFSRIGDGGRAGIFRLVSSQRSGEPAFRLELPTERNATVDDYTASLVVRDRLAARAADLGGATAVAIRARGTGPRQQLHLTLVEADGTSWSAPVALDSTWSDVVVPLSAFAPARGVSLPMGFPGIWNYWMSPASGRGGPGDAVRIADVERLQFSVRRDAAPGERMAPYGAEIESVALRFR